MTRIKVTTGPAKPAPLTSHRPLLVLCALTGALAAVAAGIGFFAGGGVGFFTATNVHGEAVQMYGRGIYEYDSLFRGSGQRGVDAVSLFVAIPLLAVSAWYYRRGSLRALLTLTGGMVWFAYIGISYVAGVAYNALFLLYVALFSCSLFGLILAFAQIDKGELVRRIDGRMPRRAPATFLFFSAFVTTGVWLMNPVEGMFNGKPPSQLETYTSLFTNGLDLAVIVPSLVLSGILILRRDPFGYAVGIPLTLFAALLAPMLTAMTVVQVQAGVKFTAAEIVGPIGGFAVLAAVAIWLVVELLRHISDSLAEPRAARRASEPVNNPSAVVEEPATYELPEPAIVDRTFPTPRPVSLYAEIPSGRVSVRAADTGQTQVHVEGRRAGEVAVEQRDSTVAVVAPHHRVRLLDYLSDIYVTVILPSESSLTTETGSADVMATGRYAAARIRSGSGAVRIEDLTADCVVETASGNVEISSCLGELRVTAGSGDVAVGRVRGSLLVSDGSGSVDVGEADETASLSTQSGHIRVGDAHSDLSAVTGAGNVYVGSIRHGAVKANASSGDIHIGVPAGVPVWTDISCGRGTVTSNLVEAAQPIVGDGHVEIHATTLSGDVDLAQV